MPELNADEEILVLADEAHRSHTSVAHANLMQALPKGGAMVAVGATAARVATAIAGHEHYYDFTTRHGRDYIAMGTTGGVWLSRGPGAFDHVAWVTMTDDQPIISLIRTDGMLDVRGPK